MDRVLVLLLVLSAVAALSAWWRRRDGRIRPTADLPLDHHLPGTRRAPAADLLAALDAATPLVFVEFTAPHCAPCARTAAILDELAAGRQDVSVRTVDIAEGLDLARAHRVLRAPTTLLVDADGQVLGRVSGVPRRDELVALLDGARTRQRT